MYKPNCIQRYVDLTHQIFHNYNAHITHSTVAVQNCTELVGEPSTHMPPPLLHQHIWPGYDVDFWPFDLQI